MYPHLGHVDTNGIRGRHASAVCLVVNSPPMPGGNSVRTRALCRGASAKLRQVSSQEQTIFWAGCSGRGINELNGPHGSAPSISADARTSACKGSARRDVLPRRLVPALAASNGGHRDAATACAGPKTDGFLSHPRRVAGMALA